MDLSWRTSYNVPFELEAEGGEKRTTYSPDPVQRSLSPRHAFNPRRSALCARRLRSRRPPWPRMQQGGTRGGGSGMHTTHTTVSRPSAGIDNHLSNPDAADSDPDSAAAPRQHAAAVQLLPGSRAGGDVDPLPQELGRLWP